MKWEKFEIMVDVIAGLAAVVGLLAALTLLGVLWALIL